MRPDKQARQTYKMADLPDPLLPSQSAFCSSVSADVWHDQKGDKAYEWWHFDALSDDGLEAVAITFTDNNVFSTRYAKPFAAHGPLPLEPAHEQVRSPAISFLYWAGGRSVVKTVAEYPFSAFSGSVERPECRIGANSFHVETTSYGNGYMISIDLPLKHGRRVQASFEWLSVESDLSPCGDPREEPSFWNLVAARSDVSGRIEVFGGDGRSTNKHHFRGTGYHDHVCGDEAIYDAINCRQWGRAHFVDQTAVYCVQKGRDGEPIDTKLVLTGDREMSVHSADVEPRQMHRDKFGIKYPLRLELTTGNGTRLIINVIKPIDSTFYNVRLLSEMTLELPDGKPRKTSGLTSILSPANMKYRLFRWFTELQFAKYGNRPNS